METLVIEEMIKRAEDAFERKAFAEAVTILEEVLSIEPYHSKAHNHIGWVYLVQFNNVKIAEKHLQIALKKENAYGPAFIHMTHLLFNMGRINEMLNLLARADGEGAVDKAFINNEYGQVFEIQGKFSKAIKKYKKAYCACFDEHELAIIRENIHRCRNKRWVMLF